MKLDLLNRILIAVAIVALILTGLRLRPRPPLPDQLVLAAVPEGEASRLSISEGRRKLRIVRPSAATAEELGDLAGTEAEWIVVTPGEARGPADVKRIEAMLGQLRTPVRASVRAFPFATIDALADLGFDRPDTLLLNIERSHNDEILSVEFGKPTRKGRFLRSEGLGPVYVISVPGMELLTADPAVWRERSGRSDAARDVGSFGIDGPRGTVEFTRKDGSWLQTSPRPLPESTIPVVAVDQLVGDLVALRTWGDDDEDSLLWPSSGPVVKAWYVARDGVRHAFEIAPVSGDADQVPVWRSPETPHRELDPAVYARLARSPDTMGRPLITLSPGDATIRLSSDRDRASLVRRNQSWTYSGAVDVGVAALADALTALDLAPAALADSMPERGQTLRIAVSQSSGESMLEVSLAPEPSGLHPARAGETTALLRPEVVGRWLALLPRHNPPPPTR